MHICQLTTASWMMFTMWCHDSEILGSLSSPYFNVWVEKLIWMWTQGNVLNNLFYYQWITPHEGLTWSLHIFVYHRYMSRLICFFWVLNERPLWLYLGATQICEWKVPSTIQLFGLRQTNSWLVERIFQLVSGCFGVI